MTETKTYCDHCGKELNAMHDYVDLQVFENALQVAVDANKRSASYVRGVYLNKMQPKQSKKEPAVDEGAAKRLAELNRQRRKENES